MNPSKIASFQQTGPITVPQQAKGPARELNITMSKLMPHKINSTEKTSQPQNPSNQDPQKLPSKDKQQVLVASQISGIKATETANKWTI